MANITLKERKILKKFLYLARTKRRFPKSFQNEIDNFILEGLFCIESKKIIKFFKENVIIDFEKDSILKIISEPIKRRKSKEKISYKINKEENIIPV